MLLRFPRHSSQMHSSTIHRSLQSVFPFLSRLWLSFPANEVRIHLLLFTATRGHFEKLFTRFVSQCEQMQGIELHSQGSKESKQWKKWQARGSFGRAVSGTY